MKLRLDYQGELLTVDEIAAKIGLSKSAVWRRRIGDRVMDAAEYAAMPRADHPRAKRIFFKGDSLTIREWSEKTGIPYYTLYARIHRYKWPLKYALHAPLAQTAFDTITYRGHTKTFAEWAKVAGITATTLRLRLYRYRWDVARALLEPSITLEHRNTVRRNRRIIRRIAASFHSPAKTPRSSQTFTPPTGTGAHPLEFEFEGSSA